MGGAPSYSPSVPSATGDLSSTLCLYPLQSHDGITTSRGGGTQAGWGCRGRVSIAHSRTLPSPPQHTHNSSCVTRRKVGAPVLSCYPSPPSPGLCIPVVLGLIRPELSAVCGSMQVVRAAVPAGKSQAATLLSVLTDLLLCPEPG